MRFISLALFYAFIVILPVHAEKEINRETLDYVLQTPNYTNLSQITRYLIKPYRTDYDKARAIAYYIASHIAYDEYLYNNNKKTSLRSKRNNAQDVLQSRVGVCTDFALLFKTMCQMAGIRAYTVHGYLFDVDNNMRVNKMHRDTHAHAWNYFDYQRRKILVDVTGMAQGRTGYEEYVTNAKRQRAVNELKKQNKTYGVTPFYFDFNEKEEKELHHKTHEPNSRY